VVEGQLGLSATVNNLEPTTGGTDTRSVGADEEDRIALREVVLNELQNAAEMQIRAQIGADDLLLIDTLEVVETIEEEFSPPEGEAGSTLSLTMEVEFMARYILTEDLRQLSSSSLNALTQPGFAPFGDMTFEPQSEPSTDSSGVTHFQLEASQITLRSVDAMQVFNLIRGRNIQSAQSELQESLSLRENPQIEVTPSWWKWLPLIPFNISVEIK
jgi:hypothetical protein